MKKGGIIVNTTCMFLIYLIILLPIYSANVIAIQFESNITGIDGITGFRKTENDYTKISVIIKNETVDELVDTKIVLLNDPTAPFDCESITLGYYCELIYSNTLPPGPQIYELQIFDHNNNFISDIESKLIIADNKKPEITEFELSREDENITIQYSILEKSYDGASDICLGIDRVELYLGTDLIKEIKILGIKCELKHNITSIKIIPPEQTQKMDVCIRAYDRLGLSNEDCKEFTMDFSKANILNLSLYSNDKKLTYISGTPIVDASLTMYIEDETGIDYNTLYVDFSELNKNPAYAEIYNNISYNQALGSYELEIKNSINNGKNLTKITWKNLMIDLNHANPKIKVNVKDLFGNLLTQTRPILLDYDDVSPIIEKITTQYCDAEENCWLAPEKNNINVFLTEEGSGFNERWLILDTSSLGIQKTNNGDNTLLFPNNCTPGWNCVYKNIIVTKDYESGKQIGIKIDGMNSYDDAGNSFLSNNNQFLYYDNEPPILINNEIPKICPSAPNMISYIFNVTDKDSGNVIAVVNTSSFSTEISPMIFPCNPTEINNNYECHINIPNLYTGHIEDIINISIQDLVGNQNDILIKQELCRGLDTEPPNTLRPTANGIPNPLDKSIAGIISYPAFANLNLNPQTNTEVQDMRILSCESEYGEISEPYIVTPYEFIDPTIGFRIALNPDLINGINSININCEMEFIIKSGNTIYKLPEVENISISYNLEGTVFGGLDSSLQKKLEDIEKSILSTEKEIDDYTDKLKVMGKICAIAETLALLVGVIQVFKIITYAIGWVVAGIIAGVSFGSASDKGLKVGGGIYFLTCFFADWVTVIVNVFFWQFDSEFIRPTPAQSTALTSPGFYIKIICASFNCRLGETNNFIETTLNRGSANGGSYTFEHPGSNEMGEPNNFRTSASVSTFLPGTSMITNYDWSPYKSIHAARATLCLPGIKYNLEKKRQIQCIQRNCVKDAAASGVPVETCDEIYKTQKCMYVDSAAWIATDSTRFDIFMQSLMERFLTTFIVTIMGENLRWATKSPYPTNAISLGRSNEVIKSACGDKADTALTKGGLSLVYGATIGALYWMDLRDWMNSNSFDLDRYEAELYVNDYCVETD